MRALSFTLCLLGCGLPGLSGAASKYPRVEEVQGKVSWINKDKKEGKPKLGQTLIEKAELVTGEGQVLVQMDANRQLRLYPQSRLVIPSISWETGEAPVIILKQGSFRWKETAGKTYNIALSSDLFEFISPQGDFIFSFDSKKALAEVKVIRGSMEFSAMNAEDVALVAVGQKCHFQGVRENDEIVYDVLLKGKKIPRGKLGLVENFSSAEKKLYSEDHEKKEGVPHFQKDQAEKNNKVHSRGKDEICEQPYAKLNQCVWICENNPKKEKKVCRLENPEVRCLRKRCNANGEWAEETEIPKEKAKNLCGLRPLVKDCDY
jgi:hypothetical protein